MIDSTTFPRVRRPRIRSCIPVLAIALLTTGLQATAPAAAGTLDKKLQKKMAVMEMVIDEVLRESPNLLIWGSEPTSSIYLDEFGVVFNFEASLVSKDKDEELGLAGLKYLDALRGLRVEREGDRIVVYRDENEDGKPDADSDSTKLETLLKDRDQREAARYEDGKKELLEVLLDYGDTLDQLRDDQFVALTAFFKSHEFFEQREMSRLVLKARVSDLKQMGDGKISRQQMRDRIVIEEY
jgi:hypothetical protein